MNCARPPRGFVCGLDHPAPGRDTFRVTRVRGEEVLISEVQARLVAKFAQLPPDHVARAVAEAHARFEQSRVRDFVPLLVERRAGDDLFKQAQLVSS
jgi:hypothetical protein